MKAKRNNTGRKLNTGIIKDFLFLFFIIGVYFASVCFLGFENTNVKLLTLVFYAIIGFVSFYLVFILARIVSDLVKKNKNLAKISNKIEHDGYLYDSDSKPFKYDIKKSIGENFTALLDVCFSEVKYVSDLASNDGRYGYLNFTMADALDFSNDSLSQIESKIDEAL
ncbi:MAG: hypothetical protein J6Q38_03110, partial [Clostridia bacterium]|nr:hypothetical protein [Clostridia bacterium]